MIEVCTLKRIIFLTVFAVGACLIILTLDGILEHDNDRSKQNSSEGCWEREIFEVKEACSPCTEFERASKHIPVCVQSKYKELVSCTISGDVYRRCDNNDEAHKFWIFEASMIVLGAISASTVILRQRHLDRKMFDKIQQQVSVGV
ncbi:protein JTB-like [Ornithodoros turicata]|uniref:Putative conserved plasma membrane protein n=1 Tax=Ornithodoros turicata TaxID=34597 RepID=A0A2R5LHY4_9ACAR